MADKKSLDRTVVRSGRQFEEIFFPRAAQRHRREERALDPRAAGERLASKELRRLEIDLTIDEARSR